MPKRPILTIPHPILKTKASPVDSVTDAVRAQMDDMLETMAGIGIGLAANQIGLLNRVLVMDVERDGFNTGPVCMANPEIVWSSEERSQMDEGCLSIPGQYALVDRPARVKVRYLDYHGKAAELDAHGLVSHCVQHEIDHLDGILCIDYLSTLKRNMIIRKVEKMRKDQEIL
jgi:peptide deformylase